MIINTYVVQRVLLILYGDSTGSAFVVEHDQKQYIVTAKHVVFDPDKNIGPSRILVRCERQWMSVPVSVVGLGEGNVDIAVLAPESLVAVVGAHPTLSEELIYGQDVAFLGFPFGWTGGGEYLNNGYPMPLVKAGVLSAIISPTETDDASIIYIDAHGNPGFSGGPLVYKTLNGKNQFGVAGVITHVLEDASTKNNIGFVRAVGIKAAVKMIEANPIGTPIKQVTAT